ncbi:MAG: hypothetical protein PHP50_13095 [Lachnospiraceae bacterium]|nr:hypothetical protein [Lachnospiraceae bacterium]
MIFRCNNCGGNMIYSPEHKGMYCPHCEGINSEKVVEDDSVTNCVSCGAPLSLEEYTSAGKCPNCGNYLIFEERLQGDKRPHLVLPFMLGREKTGELLKEQFGKCAFTPDSFLQEGEIEKITGSYVPFWMYDYAANCDYQGEGTKIRTWIAGDTEYTETSFYSVVRNMDMKFQKIPVDASIAMEDGIMDKLEPYQYQELEDFQEKYLSGYQSEVVNEPADLLKTRAEDKVSKFSEEVLHQVTGGYATLRTIHKEIKIEQEKADFSLLPVWIYKYFYRNKSFDFYVNGQTGKIVGALPISWLKVFLYGGTVWGLSFVTMMLLRVLL